MDIHTQQGRTCLVLTCTGEQQKVSLSAENGVLLVRMCIQATKKEEQKNINNKNSNTNVACKKF